MGVFVKMPTCGSIPVVGQFRAQATPRMGRVGPELVYLFRREIAIAFDFSSELNFGGSLYCVLTVIFVALE